jgi:hypothetical protein
MNTSEPKANNDKLKELGWQQMQTILDKEMPARKRRRIAFWWPLGIVGIGAMIALFVLYNPGDEKVRESEYNESKKINNESVNINAKIDTNYVSSENKPNVVTNTPKFVENSKASTITHSAKINSEEFVASIMEAPQSKVAITPALVGENESTKVLNGHEKNVPIVDFQKSEISFVSSTNEPKIRMDLNDNQFTSPHDLNITSSGNEANTKREQLSEVTPLSFINYSLLINEIKPENIPLTIVSEDLPKNSRFALHVSGGTVASYLNRGGIGYTVGAGAKWNVWNKFYIGLGVYFLSQNGKFVLNSSPSSKVESIQSSIPTNNFDIKNAPFSYYTLGRKSWAVPFEMSYTLFNKFSLAMGLQKFVSNQTGYSLVSTGRVNLDLLNANVDSKSVLKYYQDNHGLANGQNNTSYDISGNQIISIFKTSQWLPVFNISYYPKRHLGISARYFNERQWSAYNQSNGKFSQGNFMLTGEYKF